MRTARPPPLPHSGRGPYGRVPVHRGLVQPPPPPLRPRLSVANQLRKESLLKAVIRKPSAVHRNGVTPTASNAMPYATFKVRNTGNTLANEISVATSARTKSLVNPKELGK